MTIDLAIVPVAGQGLRLLPSTKSQPKEMLPVGRKPAVQYVVEELALSGIRRLLFITGPNKPSIENHFDRNRDLINLLRQSGQEDLLQELDYERQSMEYFYTRQRNPLGVGHAVLCAKPLVGSQPFAVALGDTLIGTRAESDIVARMIKEFEQRQADVVLAFEEVPPEDVIHYGIAAPKSEAEVFELADMVEKPSREAAPSNLAAASRYVFSPKIFECLERAKPDLGGLLQLTDAIRLMIRAGGKVYGMRLGKDERRFDIGDFELYFQAFFEHALADPKDGEAFRKYARARLDQSE